MFSPIFVASSHYLSDYRFSGSTSSCSRQHSFFNSAKPEDQELFQNPIRKELRTPLK